MPRAHDSGRIYKNARLPHAAGAERATRGARNTQRNRRNAATIHYQSQLQDLLVDDTLPSRRGHDEDRGVPWQRDDSTCTRPPSCTPPMVRQVRVPALAGVVGCSCWHCNVCPSPPHAFMRGRQAKRRSAALQGVGHSLRRYEDIALVHDYRRVWIPI